MSNITNITGLNTSLSYHPAGSHVSAQGHSQVIDPANNLGYGMGKLLRGTFDALAHAWQKMWTPVLSEESLIAKRQIAIYQKGLQECVEQLSNALEHLRTNLRDPGALQKINALAAQYAAYLGPPENSEQRALQLKALTPLVEKIARTAHPHLKTVLQQILPLPMLEKTHTKRALQQTSIWPASFNLTTLTGANGFAIPGIAVSGGLGTSVSTAGDLNGDGRADLVLGAWGVSSNAGAAYVLFGQAGGWTPAFNLATLNGTNGFAIPSVAAGDFLGNSVSTAGDLNGDGKADLVLGAPGVSSGAAYVLFGQASGWPAQFNLATLNGLNGFAVNDLAAGDYLGGSVSTAGDINHDGIADLVLGAPGGSTNGTVYVIFGQNTSLVTSTPSTVPSFSTSPSTVRSTPLPTTLNLASITIQVKIPPGLNGTFIPITADILSISTTTIAVPQSN